METTAITILLAILATIPYLVLIVVAPISTPQLIGRLPLTQEEVLPLRIPRLLHLWQVFG